LFYLIFSVKGKSIISICSWKTISSFPIAPARSSRSAGAAPTAAACAAAATAPASHLIPAVRRLAVRIRPSTTPDGSPTPNALPAAGMRTRIGSCFDGCMVAQQPTRHDVMPAPGPRTPAMLRQERHKGEACAHPGKSGHQKLLATKRSGQPCTNYASAAAGSLPCWGEQNEAAAVGLPGRVYRRRRVAAAASPPSGTSPRTPRP